MNNDDIMRESLSGEMPQRAVSLYGQNDGVEDFPVLKAFQQYIDAEQEKARKRIVSLGVVFAIVLVAIIIVFMFLLHGINTRNQALSDRLVEYAMKESERFHMTTSAAQTTQDNAALKTMTDTLLAIQKQMTGQEASAVKSGEVTPAALLPKDENASIAKEKALLELERQRLNAEKERLRQIEIDHQRRKLYPELYERDYAENNSRETASRRRERTLTDNDIREILREAFADSESPSAKSAKAEPAEKIVKNSDKNVDEDDGAIEYYNEDDYTIPVDVSGTSKKVKFTVPVE